MEQSLQMLSKQERLANWSERITACRNSGMTIRKWCKENNVPEKSYYYWQHRLFETLAEQQKRNAPCFTEITPVQSVYGNNVAVTIRIAGAEADIHAGADAVTIDTVLRVLKSC